MKMTEQKLFRYLSNLDKSEYKDFKKILTFSLQRIPKMQLSFLAYLEKNLLDKHNAEKLKIEEITFFLFQNSNAANKKKVYELSYEILSKLKSWLAQQELLENKLWYNLFLTRAIAKRAMHEEFMEVSTKNLQEVEDSQFQDIDNLFASFSIRREMYQHPQSNKLDISLNASVEALEKFYLINKFRLSIEQKYLRSSIVQNENDKIINDWNELTHQLQNSNYTIVKYYFALVEILEDKTENDALILDFWQNLLDNILFISPADLKFLSFSLTNLCIQKIKKGKKYFYDIFLSIYLTGFDKGYLLENEQITRATFRNIAFVYSKQQDQAAFDSFISKYGTMLNEDLRGNAIALAKAQFLFIAKKYQEAQTELNLIIQPEAFTNYSRYLLEISIFAESEYYDLLESKINAFRKFISRDTVFSEEKKAGYANFLKMISSLYHSTDIVPLEKKLEKMEKLTNEIEKTPNLVSRDWLLTHALDLRKKAKGNR